MVSSLRKTRTLIITILFLTLIGSFLLSDTLQFSLGETSYDNCPCSIVKQADSWFDINWNCSKRIEVYNPGVALTNYSVKIGLTENNFDYPAAQIDGNDLRFTYLDNVTLLNYWIEEWNYAATSYVWVKIPTLEASVNTSILLYFGYESAVSLSNGSLVFDVFDDFSGSKLNTDLWNVQNFTDGTQNHGLKNGELNVNATVRYYGNDSGYYFNLNRNLTLENYAITLKSRWENLDHYRGFGIFNGMVILDDDPSSYFQTVALWGDDHVSVFRSVDSTSSWVNVADLSEGNAYMEYRAVDNNYKFLMSGSYNYDYEFTNDDFDDPFQVSIRTRLGGRDESEVHVEAYYDYFFIRNYTEDDPLVIIEDEYFFDNSAPTIVLVTPMEFGTYPENTTITLYIDDEFGSWVDLKFNWDANLNTTHFYTEGTFLHLSLPTEPGVHVLYVYAKDDSGNEAFDLFIFNTETPTTPNTYTTIISGHSYIAIFMVSFVILSFVYMKYRKRK